MFYPVFLAFSVSLLITVYGIWVKSNWTELNWTESYTMIMIMLMLISFVLLKQWYRNWLIWKLTWINKESNSIKFNQLVFLVCCKSFLKKIYILLLFRNLFKISFFFFHIGKCFKPPPRPPILITVSSLISDSEWLPIVVVVVVVYQPTTSPIH